MSTVLLRKIADVRNWLSKTSPWVLMTFTEIEDEIFALESRVLGLREENYRLRRLLHPGIELGSSGPSRAENA